MESKGRVDAQSNATRTQILYTASGLGAFLATDYTEVRKSSVWAHDIVSYLPTPHLESAKNKRFRVA